MAPRRRRKKPWYRPRNILIAISLFIAGTVGLQLYLALTAKPGDSINYANKVAELIENYQPPGTPRDAPNAYDLLGEAIALESQVNADMRAKYPMANGFLPIDYSVLRGPVDNRYYKKALPQIKAHSLEAIQQLRKSDCFNLMAQAAATKRAVRPTPQGRLIDIMLPSLGKFRNLARLNGARMAVAWEAGDDAEHIAAFEQTLALGRVSAQGSFLIEHLVGIAIDALAFGELEVELVEKPPKEETLVALLAALDRQTLPPLRLAMEAEKLGTLDAIQWTHTDDGNGSGRLITTNLPQLGWTPGMQSGSGIGEFTSWRIFNIAGSAFPSKAANIRRTDQMFDLIFKAADKPFATREVSIKEAEDFVENLPRRYIVLRMMLPAIGKAVQSRDQIDTQAAGIRTMLAIEIFRCRQGRYPTTLDELVPSVLPALPLDPFTGLKFGYRILDPSEDPDHRRYTLYSFGADKTDNHGNSQAKNEFLALRALTGRGYDYVINPARPHIEPAEPDETPADEPAPAPTPPADPAPTGAPTQP